MTGYLFMFPHMPMLLLATCVLPVLDSYIIYSAVSFNLFYYSKDFIHDKTHVYSYPLLLKLQQKLS